MEAEVVLYGRIRSVGRVLHGRPHSSVENRNKTGRILH